MSADRMLDSLTIDSVQVADLIHEDKVIVK